jgi:non-ribosomal peptide synthetase component F
MTFSEQFGDSLPERLRQRESESKPQPVDDCLHHLFEAQADKFPSVPAIDEAGAILTYGEVEAKSNQIAHYLRRRGVVCGARVGLLIPRSPQLYIAILGILKAGGAYIHYGRFGTGKGDFGG